MAAEHGFSVAAVVRAAIDQVLLAAPDERTRIAAANRLLAMSLDGPAPSPTELDDLLADRADEAGSGDP